MFRAAVSRPAKDGARGGPAPAAAAATTPTLAAPARPVTATPTDPLIRLKGAARSFGRTPVFSGLDFSAKPGEVVLITGPSGAGKTTLLRLIHGQLRPSDGEVWVHGHPFHARWRRGIGPARREMAMVIQEQRLLPRLSALENVVLALMVRNPAIPHGTIRRRALESLEALSIGHRAGAFPRQLSAGERQRVSIARAVAARPRILLADEPLAGVDDDNAAVIVQLLQEAAANGSAVIVASHEGRLGAHKIVRLPGGKVFRRRSAPDVPALASPPAPWLGRLAALTVNAFQLVVVGGLRTWRRDLRLTAPALGTLSALLLLCGALWMVGAAAFHVAAQQAGQASMVRVYLAGEASPAAVIALRDRLAADRRVASVKQVSAEDARREAARRPGLDHLAGLSSSNPFPASLDVQVRKVTEVGAVAGSVGHDAAVDPAYPTSYDPDAYARLGRLAEIVAGIGAALAALFLLVGYVVVANALRMIGAARRDEVEVTRLLGARTWMLRGPFVVEGVYLGAIAGALAACLVFALWFLASRLGTAVYSQILPGVGSPAVRAICAGVMVAGPALGGLTALLGFRRSAA